MNRLKGKVAIVTGAASGLGAADARLMAAEGATVVLTDVNAEQGERVAQEIPGAIFVRHDVRDEENWKAVIALTMDKFGRLDVLVNNAGFVHFGNVEDTSLEAFRLHGAVMTEGTFLGCKHAIPAMVKSGGLGSIINISSIAAIKGMSPIVSYAAAKGAIVSMTRSVAAHCRDQGYKIRCNAVLPGAHETPMTASAKRDIAADSPALEQVNTFGQGVPEDVANLVVYLASDESRQVNGAQLVIDNCETST